MRTRASATGSGSSPGSLDIKKGGDVWNGTKGALYSYGTHKDTENRATCTAAVDVGLHRQRAHDRPKPVLSGRRHRAGPGCSIPGWRELVPQQRSRGVPVLRRRRAMHRGRRIREAPRDLGRLHVRPAVGLALARYEQRRASRRWPQPQDLGALHGLDPETTVGGATSRVGGTDYFNLPLTRSFVVTVNLNR